MASEPSGSSRTSPERKAAAARAAGGEAGAGGAGGGGGGGGAQGPVHHPRSFKLRFAAQREPGRSNVSLVKPLGLPAVVADKWYTRAGEAGEAGEADADARGAAALRRVQDAHWLGPRDKYAAPVLTSHEVGWWVRWARPEPAELRHHIRDSWWLRERVRRLPPAPLTVPAPIAARKR